MEEQIKPQMTRRGLQMETDREELAVSLKTYRLRNNITQTELARQWETSRYTLIRIERGYDVGWQTMYKVANRLIQAIAEERR